ncbi:MAG: hypothetical protein IJ455_06200 [Agathobacter sp.]|nr:hypothetical protein [Agathobacter sp.]
MSTDKPLIKAYVSQENYLKIKQIAASNKRSLSNQIEVLIEEKIKSYESEHGSISTQKTINMGDNHGTINM